jgi:CRISPR-associated protein Cas2
VIVVVLSVTPERLRGSLTRWLLEISPGVYVGHAPTRVRELLWLRIEEDVSRGRALMIWSSRGEQRLEFRVHNHAWTPIDHDGITLLRRQTAESRQIAALHDASDPSPRTRPRGNGTEAQLDDRTPRASRTWSNAGRRRRYRNSVEQRRRAAPPEGPEEQGK